ncbi:MAG: hypothetical protein M1830_001027 [Pleopsidium flavum]|nr:MAG: hypothetical protein M1830_001027 [Pleopsidium flavum]
MVGKRKREIAGAVETPIIVPDQFPSGDEEELPEAFRRHFEAQFQPLIEQKSSILFKPAVEYVEEDESDWEGISNNDENVKVEVVKYPAPEGVKRAEVPKEELKEFMTAKPPSTSSKPSSTAKRKQGGKVDAEEASKDAANLKNDLALQRLLKESHLLDPASSLRPAGSNRHKALDLRLQNLGSRSSVLAQETMPMSHRRGIVSKATKKEATRRQEARENGIILEKASKPKKGEAVRRERGIGAPGIGKFKGGMLKLSKKDVADIEGSKGATTAKRRGRK